MPVVLFKRMFPVDGMKACVTPMHPENSQRSHRGPMDYRDFEFTAFASAAEAGVEAFPASIY
jgi:hypothetical protein